MLFSDLNKKWNLVIFAIFNFVPKLRHLRCLEFLIHLGSIKSTSWVLNSVYIFITLRCRLRFLVAFCAMVIHTSYSKPYFPERLLDSSTADTGFNLIARLLRTLFTFIRIFTLLTHQRIEATNDYSGMDIMLHLSQTMRGGLQKRASLFG